MDLLTSILSDPAIRQRFFPISKSKIFMAHAAVTALAGPAAEAMSELIHKRLRWIVVMRLMRPWGHFGLLLTQGLPWSLAAIAARPTVTVAAAYLGTYFFMRCAMTWLIGVHGLKQRSVWRRMPLIPVWDALSFAIWVASFLRRSIRWRGADYYVSEGGALAPVAAEE